MKASKYSDAQKAYVVKRGEEGVRVWCQRAEREAGERPGLTTVEKDRIKELEREIRELRQANEILERASAYFAQAELDRTFKK